MAVVLQISRSTGVKLCHSCSVTTWMTWTWPHNSLTWIAWTWPQCYCFKTPVFTFDTGWLLCMKTLQGLSVARKSQAHWASMYKYGHRNSSMRKDSLSGVQMIHLDISKGQQVEKKLFFTCIMVYIHVWHTVVRLCVWEDVGMRVSVSGGESMCGWRVCVNVWLRGSSAEVWCGISSRRFLTNNICDVSIERRQRVRSGVS